MPNQRQAEALATQRLEKKWVACAQIIPQVQSLYTWEGKIERSQEAVLVLKSLDSKYADVEAYTIKHHPYEVPEIIVTQITNGSRPYLDWIQDVID